MTFLNQRWIPLVALTALVLAAVFTWQVVTLRHAHSSFENYAAFRGCDAITNRTTTSGTCTLADGTSITLVQFRDRWYLQGDLPTCWSGFCF